MLQFTSLIATTSPNKIRDLVTADKKRITAYRDSDGYCYFEFLDGLGPIRSRTPNSTKP